MNVIYHNFSFSYQTKIISQLFNKYSWKPVCVVGSFIENGKIDTIPIDGCLVCDPFKIRRAEFNYDEIGSPVPIDASIIEALSQFEATYIDSLGMFQDKTGWEFSYAERKNFYIDILTYWNTIIKKSKPDLIVFYTWPHTPSCYALYLICKHYYDIAILFIDPNPLLDSGLHLINNSVEKLSYPIEIALSARDKNDSDSVSVKEFIDAAKINTEPRHIAGDFNKFEYDETYHQRIKKYFLIGNKLLNLTKIHMHLKGLSVDRKANRLPYTNSKSRMNLVQLFVFFQNLKYKNRRLKKEYHAKTVSPDLNSSYIYFSAPYQPEATSYLCGKHYENLMVTLRALSFVCPKEWVIYYKEHPATFFEKFRGSFKRGKDLYDEILSLQNIKLVPSDFDQFLLIEKSRAVALVSGSSAWQGIIRGKPVISFGQSWYSSCEGIMEVSSIKDIKKSIQLISSGFKPSNKSIDQYVSAIKDVAFHFPEHYSWEAFDIERAENVADEFKKAYEKFYQISKRNT